MRDRAAGLAGLAGALWGLGGYAALWGLTPVVVHRSFVVSAAGTAALLPVRLVLWGIRGVEGLVGRPFELASRTEWIGLLAAAVGAALATSTFVLARGTMRRLRRARTAG